MRSGLRVAASPDKVGRETKSKRDDTMANQTDMKAHSATYEGVIGLMKWGALASAIVAAIVVWLIA